MSRGHVAAGLVALCAVVLFLPGIPPFWITLGNTIGIASVVVIGLVVLTGHGGMTSFGQAIFMGFGAYTTALLTSQWHWSPWLTLPVSLIASGLGALAIGAITLRLSGHYLALGTIAWGVSVYYLFGNLDFFGRNDGVQGIPALAVGGLSLADSRLYFPVVWACVGVSLLAAEHLLDSRPGRAIRSLRGGGAAAAASCGANIASARMLAFVFAGVLAGLAGWLYAHMQRSVNPTPFGVAAGIDYLLMAVVGGAGSLAGALLGAALITVVNDRLQDALPYLLGSQGDYQSIVFGILLVVMLQMAPQGLWPLLSRRPRPGRSRQEAPALPRRTLPDRGALVLQADGLRKTFGGLVAVDHFDLRLAAGEIVGLIGPNGAGKSTIFNLLTGVARPSDGRIRFLTQDITGLPPRSAARLGIARSFQHVKLAPGMSVIENVAIGAHLRGHRGALAALLRLDRAEERRLFAEAARQLDRVGLIAFADRPANSLALGQQRIVEIARALCLDPVLLLLDEPAAGLRHAEKVTLAALLRRLRAEGMTVLLVEHDMDFVMELTDRLVVLDFGTKLADGPPASIRDNPAVIEAYLGSVA